MDLEYSNLNVLNSSEKEIMEALKKDYCVYLKMQRKILELKKAQINKVLCEQEDNEISDNSVVISEKISDIDVDFEGEVDYYYSMVSQIDSQNFERSFIETLPSPENYQYKKILLRISAEILRNIKFIKELLNEQGVTNEDIESFSEDINLEYQKINKIKELLDEKVEYTSDFVVKKNNLILLPTLSENIRIIEDISNIDIEYYDRFYELINSIENGTFKNVRRFKNNENLDGLCEVRDFKTRLLFKRFNMDTYVLIGAFVKKTDNDSFYRSKVVGYYELYKKIEFWLSANIDNLQFIDSQEAYKKELFDMLQDKKTFVKIKGGK